jgi:hypothetical protein
VIPETAPALVMSQEDESIATVPELLPSVVAPVDERVVKQKDRRGRGRLMWQLN